MTDTVGIGAVAFQAPRPGAGAAGAVDVSGDLAPVLVQLEAARREVRRRVDRRGLIAIPLGATLGFWIYWLLHSGHLRADASLLLPFAGAALGYLGSAYGPAGRYARLYKQEVLPRLLARFGALTWRPAVLPDLSGLRREGVLPAYDSAKAEDEIFGTYRGLSVSIIELRLRRQEGRSTVVTFDGLLLRLIRPSHLLGVTTVVADGGVLAGLGSWIEPAGRQRVKLEDPEFERAYDVYGTDQVEARALLTPTFMERFLALGERPGWGRPLLYAENQRLAVTLPKQTARDLFAPPPSTEDAESQPALVRIQHDLAAVFSVVDALLDCVA